MDLVEDSVIPYTSKQRGVGVLRIDRRFTGKVVNGLDYWYTFLTVPGVDPTNRAKRALRGHVVQRKIMGCFRNGKGTWICETVMTVLSSWKLQGRGLPKALGETLTQEWNKI